MPKTKLQTKRGRSDFQYDIFLSSLRVYVNTAKTRKDVQRQAKISNDRQRHTKTFKGDNGTQRQTKTCKDGKKTFKVDRRAKRHLKLTKTHKDGKKTFTVVKNRQKTHTKIHKRW